MKTRYRFTLEGLRAAHFGDVGNALSGEQLSTVNCDIVLAPAGGLPTIRLADPCRTLEVLRAPVIAGASRTAFAEQKAGHNGA